jgi:hypothetical protein
MNRDLAGQTDSEDEVVDPCWPSFARMRAGIAIIIEDFFV